MTNKPQIGCYGSAVFYSANAQECVACPVSASCSELSLFARIRAVETVKSLDCQFVSALLPEVIARIDAGSRQPAPDTKRAAAQAKLKDWETRGVNAYLIGHSIVPHGLTRVELLLVEAMIASEKFSVQDLVEQTKGLGIPASTLATTAKEIIAALVEANLAKKNKKRGVFSI